MNSIQVQDQSEERSGRAPTVSVVMPCYNVAEYINDALESVLKQTFRDYEILVINDGSPDTDALERVLEPHRQHIVYIKYEDNRGPSAARNAGIRAARGRYIAFLDPDDIWEPNYLDVQLGILEGDPTIDVLYPDAVIFGDVPESGKTYMELCSSEGEVTLESLIRQQCTVPPAVTARAEILARAGLFDESLQSCEDFDLWIRVLDAGGRIEYHRQPLIHYRRRGGSLSSDSLWMHRHVLEVLDKTERTLKLTAAQREALAQARARYRSSLRLEEGRKAFVRGDIAEAINGLTEANVYMASRKVGMVLVFMRLAPGLLMKIYNLRDRLLFQTSTKL
jgi:glycosyltransferase involved in cell wall biosynthesis